MRKPTTRLPHGINGVLGWVIGAIAIFVAIAIARGWFTDEPPSVEARTLNATDVDVWTYNKILVGGQLLVLNNDGGAPREVLSVTAAFPGGRRSSVKYWSLDTCASGAVPLTRYHAYVMLLNPTVSHSHAADGSLNLPFYEQGVTYVVQLNTEQPITVSETLSKDEANSFEGTAESIVDHCVPARERR